MMYLSIFYKKSSLLILFLISLNFLFVQNANAQVLVDKSKPIFVEISTDWCYACQILKPTIDQLKTEYGTKANFIRLDFTNDVTKAEAIQTAFNLGIEGFLAMHGNAFPTVGILCNSGTDADGTFLGAQEISVYKGTLNNLLLGSCSFSDREIADADKGNGRPKETEFKEDEDFGRGKEIGPTKRPELISGSGRPNEFEFYKLGEPVPLSAYFTTLPECNDGQTILCFKRTTDTNASSTKSSPYSPVITTTSSAPKPFTPKPPTDPKGFGDGAIIKK